MKKKPGYFLPAISWLIISTILLVLPGTAFPKQTWLDKIWFDKWVHIGMFAILVVLWCYPWRAGHRNSDQSNIKGIFIFIGLAAIFYGIMMELVQHYLIPYRGFDIGDIIADIIGSAAGVIFSNYVSRERYIKK